MNAWFKSLIHSFLQPVLRFNLSLGFIDDSQYPRAHGQASSAWADSTNVVIDNWSVSQTFCSLDLSQLWIIVSCFSCRVWFIHSCLSNEAAGSDTAKVLVPGRWSYQSWPRTVIIHGQSNWAQAQSWHEVQLVHYDLCSALHSSFLDWI